MAITAMTTISVKEDVKEDLLRYASKLQVKMGRRVDYNEAIRFLLMEKRKHPSLLAEACTPTAGAEDTKRALTEERGLDEERAERRLRR
jgi:predicted CopG family antitoxin